MVNQLLISRNLLNYIKVTLTVLFKLSLFFHIIMRSLILTDRLIIPLPTVICCYKFTCKDAIKNFKRSNGKLSFIKSWRRLGVLRWRVHLHLGHRFRNLWFIGIYRVCPVSLFVSNVCKFCTDQKLIHFYLLKNRTKILGGELINNPM